MRVLSYIICTITTFEYFWLFKKIYYIRFLARYILCCSWAELVSLHRYQIVGKVRYIIQSSRDTPNLDNSKTSIVQIFFLSLKRYLSYIREMKLFLSPDISEIVLHIYILFWYWSHRITDLRWYSLVYLTLTTFDIITTTAA